MSIPTKMVLNGFVATEPDLHFTSTGAAYCRLRVGVEQWRKEANGSFTPLEPTFHDMVSFDATAREIYARFRPGDSFIASGYVHEFETRSGEIREEFVARKIGHNANRTNYAVIRPKQSIPAEPPPPAPAAEPPAVGF